MDISYSISYKRKNSLVIKHYYKFAEDLISIIFDLLRYHDLEQLVLEKHVYKDINTSEVSES